MSSSIWCATATCRAPSRASTAANAPSEIRTSLDPQCLSGFRKNEQFEIEHSDVILTVDSGDFVFLDCAYEELLQSLGPINDTSSVPWTMFNDNVSMGFFDVYDQYILNLLYDPRIKAGMTVQEVKAVLPEVLADVRAWVAQGQQSAGVAIAPGCVARRACAGSRHGMRRPEVRALLARLEGWPQVRAAHPSRLAEGGSHLGMTRMMWQIRQVLGMASSLDSSLRANGSRECAPDDRLREAIQSQAGAGLLRRKSSSQ